MPGMHEPIDDYLVELESKAYERGYQAAQAKADKKSKCVWCGEPDVNQPCFVREDEGDHYGEFTMVPWCGSPLHGISATANDIKLRVLFAQAVGIVR